MADVTALSSTDGRVLGTYCHGLLATPGLRTALLARIGVGSNGTDHAKVVDAALDELATKLERHLNVAGLLTLARAART